MKQRYKIKSANLEAVAGVLAREVLHERAQALDLVVHEPARRDQHARVRVTPGRFFARCCVDTKVLNKPVHTV